MIAVACEPSVYLGVYIIQCCTSQLARVSVDLLIVIIIVINQDTEPKH